MIIGSTPTHSFGIPFSTNLINELVITYSQNEGKVLEKTLADCVVSESKIELTLTQEETLKFVEGIYCVQLKVKTRGDKVSQSRLIYRRAYKTLNKEII